MALPSDVLKAWEACDRTDTLFVLVCSVFCWGIIPAVGIAYSGYTTRSNSLSAIMPSILAVTVCSVQWFLIGYSLSYSEGNAVIGDLKYAFHRGVLAEPVGTIPAVLFSFFQLVFQATVCAIAVGGAVERGRLVALVPFVFLWSTFVYNPLAHMVWGGGFLEDLGVLDFAGGTPVHINSGATATALSFYLSYPLFRSRRSPLRTPSHLTLHRPVNSLCQVLAMISIWGSWLAFDAGTTLSFNFKSVMALCVTNLCAASGALTWMLLTYYETGGRWSLDSCFMGAISGLIMITPAAGFIDLQTSFWFGVVGAVVCRQALRIKSTEIARRWRWVDHGDTFATHCVGGVLATIATGCFARKEVAGYDGVTEIAGGVFFDGNVRQLGVQIVEALVGFLWSFVGSYVIYAAIDCVPGLEVLATDEDIIAGLDASQMDDETLWAPTQKYYPFEDREGNIHLD
ncbi:ammonium transporter AmtB-like domain-containing protein [Clohesyomyces aquaticus]|uniref:Ammonium transporter AmtB-like domain-containing protein n=1 Tax=Clohesyomyces aquaticus TaxID=1231657 RepID=A0A1Y1YBT0_9PLEO|nr:ammonium transporter AmtB-like domain-containing protein [Clohesyomyces aquaticus]